MPNLTNCVCKDCKCGKPAKSKAKSKCKKPVAKSKRKCKPKLRVSNMRVTSMGQVTNHMSSMRMAKANGYECDKDGYWDPNLVSWTYDNKPTKGAWVNYRS